LQNAPLIVSDEAALVIVGDGTAEFSLEEQILETGSSLQQQQKVAGGLRLIFALRPAPCQHISILGWHCKKFRHVDLLYCHWLLWARKLWELGPGE
jgi:hypothetical protein